MAEMFHLVKRALTSFRNNPLPERVIVNIRGVLLPGEFSLWSQMQHRDQRHSVHVLARFDALYQDATRDERAAALLHDVGKVSSTLGWWGRVMATVMGPRNERFRIYLDHEALGLELLASISSPRTQEVLRGDMSDPCVVALRQADDI